MTKKEQKTWGGGLTFFPILYMDYSRNSEQWFVELKNPHSEAKVVQRHIDSKGLEFPIL